MNNPNRKRPYESIANENKEPSERWPARQSEADSSSSADCSEEESHVVPVISELQKALDYLISRSERDSVKPTNNNNQSTTDKVDSTANNQSENDLSQKNVTIATAKVNQEDDANNDHKLHTIPALINRILLEHYPTGTKKTPPSSKSSTCNVHQKILLTQLMIAVIVEFAEPHFVKMSTMQHDDPKTDKKPPAEPNNNDPPLEYSSRAVEWATSCLSHLLQVSLEAEESTHIPELDALLGASGENDGLEMEERLQCSLLCGVKGRLNGVENWFGGRKGS